MKTSRLSARNAATLGAAILVAMTAACSSGETGTEMGGPPVAEESMTQTGLLVRVEAKPGKEDEVSSFLSGALSIVEEEPGTTAWFAIRLGPSTFGVYDAFPDDTARQAHLAGSVASALMASAPDLLAQDPIIEPIDVLADKILPGDVRVGLLVRMEAKPGKEEVVASFLEDALPIAEQEPGTTAWFAIRLGPSTFGVYDAFPNDDARQAHLEGGIASALMASAPDLLAEAPVIEPVDVLAAKLPR